MLKTNLQPSTSKHINSSISKRTSGTFQTNECHWHTRLREVASLASLQANKKVCKSSFRNATFHLLPYYSPIPRTLSLSPLLFFSSPCHLSLPLALLTYLDNILSIVVTRAFVLHLLLGPSLPLHLHPTFVNHIFPFLFTYISATLPLLLRTEVCSQSHTCMCLFPQLFIKFSTLFTSPSYSSSLALISHRRIL